MKSKRYLFVVAGLQLLWFQIASAAVLLEEHFEGTFPPSGWTQVDNLDSCDWESTATTGRGNYTGGTGYAADADSEKCYYSMDAELRTPALNMAGFTGATLSFLSDFSDIVGRDDGYVDISTDGGSTWTNLLHYDGIDVRSTLVQINLSAYDGQANVLIRFRYVAPGWDWWWQIDDVLVQGTTDCFATVDYLGNTNDRIRLTHPSDLGATNGVTHEVIVSVLAPDGTVRGTPITLEFTERETEVRTMKQIFDAAGLNIYDGQARGNIIQLAVPTGFLVSGTVQQGSQIVPLIFRCHMTPPKA